MKLKTFILLLALNCLVIFRGFADNKEFENFANNQSKLMNAAYEKRDPKAYGKLLDEFKAKY